MKEDFLHYVWKYKKFNIHNLKTINLQHISILSTGQYTQQAGPDFFNTQLIIDHQTWVGNVEIHIKSSDWYAHNHHADSNYDNVILHVVWQHDIDVYRKDNSVIPVLELKNYVSKTVLDNYQSLMVPKYWIYCEKQLHCVEPFVITNWQQRLFIERLERKATPITALAKQLNNNWEALLFILLAKNFGLNTNGEIFKSIAQSIPFHIIRKEQFEVENLEALIFGNAGLLDINREDNYYKDLKFRFFYLIYKYQIEKLSLEPVQFFKHRPDNFPTIRLSQLANLYHKHQNLFSIIIDNNDIENIYEILNVSVSEYWTTHYNFDKISSRKLKSLSKSFMNLIIINTIIPIKFAYSKILGTDVAEELLLIINEIAAEDNSIVSKFKSFGINSRTALETQSLIQLKTEYCDKSKCLDCAIGNFLMR